MDLLELDLTKSADAGATLEIRHPISDEVLTDKKGNPVTVTLLGSESSAFMNEMKARARKQMGKKVKQPSIEDTIRDSAEVLAACTVSWSGMTEGGEDLPCDKATATRLYIKYTWLRQQVDEFIADRENFFKA